MNTKIYIGIEQIDFNDEINLVYSIGDIRNLTLGSNNKSYTINVPMTKTNKRIFKYIDNYHAKEEITDKGRIVINGLNVMKGSVKILSTGKLYSKIIINSGDWIDDLSNTRLNEVAALSTKAVTLTAAHVSDSWAGDPFIRFGMVHFAEMWSGVRAYWQTLDFIPHFSVVQLLTLIFAPYTITSDWIATAYAKSLFFLGVEPRKDSAFILGKNLSVKPANDAENTHDFVIPATTRDQDSFSYSPISHNTRTTDEGNDYNITTDVYTVPETGTYRFTYACKSVATNIDSGSITRHSITVEKSIIVSYLAGGGENLAQYLVTGSSDESVINNHTANLDSGYVHLSAGDTVYGYFAASLDLENTSGGSITITTFIEAATTVFSNVWDYRNLYAGLNKSINPVDYMPDKSALEFIQAIKHVANLRFFMDKRNGTVHIEPADTFFTNNDVDISELVIDLDEANTDIISSNYKQKFILQWQEDTNDKAYTRFVEEYGLSQEKEITLTSVYAQEGTEKLPNPIFAATISKNVYADPLPLPAIYGREDDVGTDYNQRYPLQRPVGYIPRIMTWEGMSAFSTWYYNDAAQTTYPEMAPIDFATLYASYYLKTFHYIDRGKVSIIRIRMTPALLMQFMGQVNDASQEAFRARYKIWDGTTYIYMILQSITTNGDIAECEFILKQ